MKPFDQFEHSGQFSAVNAYLLALTSHYMYVDSIGLPDRNDTRAFVEAYRNIFLHWGMHPHQFFYLDQSQSTQGFVMSNDHMVVVAFRGSEINQGSKEIIEDMVKTNARAIFPVSADEWAFKVDIPGWPDQYDPMITPKVHRGFYKAYQEIRPQLIYSLEQVGITRGKELYVTGHSLGGAIAVLAAFDLAKVYQFEPTSVYTFGMPRVGFQPLQVGMRTPDFRNFYNDDRYLGLRDKTFRMVNLTLPKKDAVPGLPPATGIFGNISGNYEHVGTLVHVNPDFLEMNAFEKVLGIPDVGELHATNTYARRLYSMLKNHRMEAHLPDPPTAFVE